MPTITIKEKNEQPKSSSTPHLIVVFNQEHEGAVMRICEESGVEQTEFVEPKSGVGEETASVYFKMASAAPLIDNLVRQLCQIGEGVNDIVSPKPATEKADMSLA